MNGLPIMSIAFAVATLAMLAAWYDSRRRCGKAHRDTRLWLAASGLFAVAAALPLLTYLFV